MSMLTSLQKSKSSSYKVEEPLVLESGETLQDLRIQYTTYGTLNSERSNVVWIFHALTANSDATEWWPGLVGEEDFFNPEDHFVVCANMLGSCYGTTSPEDDSFPLFTIRDIVEAHKRLKEHLGISFIKIGIGGSMGGQQLLEWAVQEPELFEIIVPIATNAIHSSWGIAFNETQRMALEHPDSNIGIEVARAIALLSYRSYGTYQLTQDDSDNRSDHFSASSYQRYQGEKLRKRFSPLSYYYLSKAMDSHNLGRNFGGIENALGRIQSKAIVIGLKSDGLFPLSEQRRIASNIKVAVFETISSDYGHDGFLIETGQITEILERELR